MPPYVGASERLIAPVALRPMSELALAGFEQNARAVRTGGAVLGPGETWLRSPGRSPDAAFTLFQVWDEVSGSASFKTAEEGLAVVGEVAADLLSVAQQINRRFDRLADGYLTGGQTALQIRSAFLKELQEDVLKSAAALQIPMVRSRVSKAAGEASAALIKVFAPRGQDALMTPSALRKEVKAVNAGATPFLRVSQELAVTLKRVTDAVDTVDRYVAMLPFAAAAMDLLAAKNEDEARLALKRAENAADEFVVSAFTSGAIGAVATLAITFSPVALGFYGIVAVRVGAGVLGLYVEPKAQKHFKERHRLWIEAHRAKP